jgi:hypothetical protein
LEIDGVRTEEKLVPVVISLKTMRVQPSMKREFLNMVIEGEEIRPGKKTDWDEQAFSQARGVAINYMARVRKQTEKDIRQVNNAVVDSQLAALKATHEAKIAQIKKVLAKVVNPNIRRMKESELANRKADFEVRRAKLQARRAVTVTISSKLAGIMHFE